MGQRAKLLVEAMLEKPTEGGTHRTGTADQAARLLPELLKQVLLDGNHRTYDVSYYTKLIPTENVMVFDEMPGLQIAEKLGAGSVIWLVSGEVIHYPHEKHPESILRRIDFDSGHVSRFYNVAHKVLSSWPDDPGDYIDGEQSSG